MAARLLWVFLTDKDVRDLLERLEQREPGLVPSGGRYFRGDAQDLMADPSKLERRESLPGEKRIYLFHRKHSADIVAHRQPAGPFAGWSQIDEERSDCLVLRLKDAPQQGELEPAQLYAHVNFWRAADKVRKRPMFSIWAAQTLKWAKTQLAQTAVKFVRIGPDTLLKARAGELRLTYLYRQISPG